MCLPFHHDARPKAEMGFEPIPIVLQTTAIAIYATQQIGVPGAGIEPASTD